MNSDRKTFDVMVMGGGPAGSLCALQLARAGARVALLHVLGRGPSAVEIVSGRARRMIERHVGDLLQINSATEIHETISLWDSQSPAHWNALRNPWGPGVSIDRRFFDRFLRTAVRQSDALIFSLKAMNRPVTRDGQWEFTVVREGLSPRTIYAPFLVQATGRSTRLFPDRTMSHNFPQLALTGRMCSEGSRPSGTFYLEKVQDGWWYAIPDASKGYFFGYCTRPERLKRRHLPLEEFFHHQLGGTQLVATLVPKSISRPAVTGRLASETIFDKAAGENWISIGDAAYVSDPLSGKGIEFAAGSSERAVSALGQTESCPEITKYQGWVDAHVRAETEEAAAYHRR